MTTVFPKYTKLRNHKNFVNVIEEGNPVILLEKLHGSNWRATRAYTGDFIHPWYVRAKNWLLRKQPSKWVYSVGSHNVIKWYKDKTYHRVATQYGFDKLGEEWNGFAFYGEIVGPGIQELTYGIAPGELKLFIFDIMFKNEYGQQHYLPWVEVEEHCARLGLETPPELYRGPWTADLVKLADGQSRVKGAKHHREGFVVKPLVETWHPHVGRVILKRISDTYLLGKNRTEFH